MNYIENRVGEPICLNKILNYYPYFHDVVAYFREIGS